ncbi:hypothetical protein EXIGLDRAFT_732341 [Exidia glandulosa HHB12029]|uniref:Uncharacterized protein n=1 Tax=Exidia glandulosa HHB12029 TaxID=1314781 RepID=A0A165KS29_EXIGL|nr:hypothetical protein EXIGLDRAFT_732341 [Exidia glandulosa HHB12029]
MSAEYPRQVSYAHLSRSSLRESHSPPTRSPSAKRTLVRTMTIQIPFAKNGSRTCLRPRCRVVPTPTGSFQHYSTQNLERLAYLVVELQIVRRLDRASL